MSLAPETLFGVCPSYPPEMALVPHYESSQASPSEIKNLYGHFSQQVRQLLTGQDQLSTRVAHTETSGEQLTGFWIKGELRDLRASFKLTLPQPQANRANCLFIEYAFTEPAAVENRQTVIIKIDAEGTGRCQQTWQPVDHCFGGMNRGQPIDRPGRQLTIADLNGLEFLYDQFVGSLVSHTTARELASPSANLASYIGRQLRSMWHHAPFED